MPPRLVKAYREAEKLKLESKNAFEWLQGRYFFDALSVALSNFSAGMANKVGKANYHEKPIRIFPMTEEEKEAERKKKLEAYRAELIAWQTAFNARKKEKKQ